VGQVDIKTRGFAARPEDIARQIRPRGSTRATLLLARVGEKPRAILAQRLPAETRD